MTPRFDLYALIDRIREKPGMWLGTASITRLHAFLGGWLFALGECGAEVGNEPDFGGLHDWVAHRFGWAESTAGWCNIILSECGSDEAKALELFFELIDEYRRTRTVTATVAPLQGASE